MSLVTYEGIEFDLTNPTPDMVKVSDIFRSLPRLNRFVGHSSRPYSVGEHTLYCMMMAKKLGYSVRERLLVAMHDFEEAYTGDCPAPLKKLIPNFTEISDRVADAIYKHFEVEPPTEEEHERVKRVDLTMLVIEMRDLTIHEWHTFINDHTHNSMLNNKDFDLNLRSFDEKEIRILLDMAFEELLNQYRKEQSNG